MTDSILKLIKGSYDYESNENYLKFKNIDGDEVYILRKEYKSNEPEWLEMLYFQHDEFNHYGEYDCRFKDAIIITRKEVRKQIRNSRNRLRENMFNRLVRQNLRA